MTTFDAPTREYCVIQRERTATPLQALTVLNDPQFVEAARVLATSVVSMRPRDDEAGLIRAFRLTTSRTPTQKEREILRNLLAEARSQFAGKDDAAKALVTVGEAPRSGDTELVELAAWTSVIQALLGFDECLTKR
jgi:hypothetical protein